MGTRHVDDGDEVFNTRTKAILEVYCREVIRLRKLGKQMNLSDDQINEAIDKAFRLIESGNQAHEAKWYFQMSCINFYRLFWVFMYTILLLCLVALHRSPSVHNYVERNVQEMIYPGMKFFRKLILPIVTTFPTLTAWYDESCLVENPYFRVVDMDCWPCQNIKSVLNLTGSDLSSKEYHSGIPFVYKEDGMRQVSFEQLQHIYNQNKEMFDRDAMYMESTGDWQSTEQLLVTNRFDLNPSLGRDAHVTWRLNRLEPTRVIRRAFGYPQHIPHYTTGAAPEKFLLFDEIKAPPYALPTTEGSVVFVTQASGTRMFVLTPVRECQKVCNRVSIVLQPHHILWFDWWYWRASSFPLVVNSEVSITYVGSYIVL